MSSRDPMPDEPGGERQLSSSRAFEPATDPGRAQPFESLYRGSGRAFSPHRATARHFEPWVKAPEGEPSAVDTFHWLYRKEPVAEESDDLHAVAAVPPPTAVGATSELRVDPPGVAELLAAADSRERLQADGSPSARRVGWLIALAVLLVVIGAVFVMQQ